MRYYHALLQTVASRSVLPKKIFDIPKTNKKRNKPCSHNYIHYHKLRPWTPSRHSPEDLLTTTPFYLFFKHFLRTAVHGAMSVINKINCGEVCGAVRGSNIGYLKKFPLSDTTNKSQWVVYRHFLNFTDRTGEYPATSLYDGDLQYLETTRTGGNSRQMVGNLRQFKKGVRKCKTSVIFGTRICLECLMKLLDYCILPSTTY
jgi:hypothetical protein